LDRFEERLVALRRIADEAVELGDPAVEVGEADDERVDSTDGS
jgi:hypothetical protein